MIRIVVFLLRRASLRAEPRHPTLNLRHFTLPTLPTPQTDLTPLTRIVLIRLIASPTPTRDHSILCQSYYDALFLAAPGNASQFVTFILRWSKSILTTRQRDQHGRLAFVFMMIYHIIDNMPAICPTSSISQQALREAG